jgi:hypothetical protein
VQAKVVVVVVIAVERFDVKFDAILEVVTVVRITLVPFVAFSRKYLTGAEELSSVAVPYPAHQHNRYSPPAALTTLVPHVTVAPLS